MEKPTVRSSLTKLARFKAAFKKHFFLRFHMMLILTGVFSSGLILSKLLLEAGLRSMLIRYLIVLALSYLMFFVFIKLWLLYVQQTSRSKSSGDGSCAAIIIPDGSSAPVSGVTDLIEPGGGEFGGGGASRISRVYLLRRTCLIAGAARSQRPLCLNPAGLPVCPISPTLMTARSFLLYSVSCWL